MMDIFLLFGIILFNVFLVYVIKICFDEVVEGFSSFVNVINNYYTTKR